MPLLARSQINKPFAKMPFYSLWALLWGVWEFIRTLLLVKSFLVQLHFYSFFFKLTFKYIFTFFAVHKQQQGKPSKWTWLLVEFRINVITAVLYFMGVYGCVVLFDFCFVYVYYMLKFNDNNNLKNYSMIILQ